MNPKRPAASIAAMAQFIIHHEHDPGECAASVASWRGFSSPLRGTETASACRFGEHRNWWRVTAVDEAGAIALLPGFVAERSEVTRIERLKIP